MDEGPEVIARVLVVLAVLSISIGPSERIAVEWIPEGMNYHECAKADYLLIRDEGVQWYQCLYLPDPRSYGWKPVSPEMPRTAFTPPPPYEPAFGIDSDL